MVFKKRYLANQSGFTLVELLVVIFIMSLLTSLILISYRSSEKRYALNQAAQQLVSNLRKAQSMAMSGVGIREQYCGYGIKVDSGSSPGSYIFYADKSGNCQNSNNKYDASDDIIETINLPNQIIIQASSPADFFFKSPDPTTYINQVSVSGVGRTITLEVESGSLSKMITITTAGLIQSN
ncbi:MAG: prepilin-type N-terminal cleavage/methylation domain-containing protein [Candidatus Komeilibacteria bacterium]